MLGGGSTKQFFQRQLDTSGMYQIDAFARAKPAHLGCTGYVLFMKELDRERVKIFYSSNIKQTLREWQASNPNAFVVLWAMPAKECQLDTVYTQFGADRLHNQWFNYTTSMYEFIVEGKYGSQVLNNEKIVSEVPSGTTKRRLHEDYVWFKNYLLGMRSRNSTR